MHAMWCMKQGVLGRERSTGEICRESMGEGKRRWDRADRVVDATLGRGGTRQAEALGWVVVEVRRENRPFVMGMRACERSRPRRGEAGKQERRRGGQEEGKKQED